MSYCFLFTTYDNVNERSYLPLDLYAKKRKKEILFYHNCFIKYFFRMKYSQWHRKYKQNFLDSSFNSNGQGIPVKLSQQYNQQQKCSVCLEGPAVTWKPLALKVPGSNIANWPQADGQGLQCSVLSCLAKICHVINSAKEGENLETLCSL